MLHVVYDGSLNGDWICDYALNMAAVDPDRRLRILHVKDGQADPARVARRMDELKEACERKQLGFDPQILPEVGGVFATLTRHLPVGEGHLVLCGVRLEPGYKGFLRGTVSDRLLKLGRYDVIALRVVKPGLLGFPRRFLIPLSGHPRGIGAAWPFISHFLPLAESVQLLRIMPLGRMRFLHVSQDTRRGLKKQGWLYLRDVLDDVRQRCPDGGFLLDGRVVVSQDWGREILWHADKLNSEMIVMGASERSLHLRHNPIEKILADAPCDVGVCRGP